MKKVDIFKALLLCVVLVVSLAGCAKSATPTAAVMEEEPEAVEEPAEVVEEPEEEALPNLTLWVYDDTRLTVLNEFGQEFEDEYGVTLTVEVQDLSEIRNAMTLGAATGEGPDMVIIPHDNLGPMVEEGAAAVIDLGDKEDLFLDPAIAGFFYNGALYGLPLSVENIGLFRNVDMVPEAPTTWQEIYDVGVALVNDGTAESAMGFPDLTYNSYPMYTWQGGYIFGRDAEGSFTADDIGMANEGMVNGLEWAYSLVEAGAVSSNIDWEASHVQFETGRSAFIMTGPWAITRFKEAGVNYAISAFPEGGFPFMGVQGIVVNASKDNVLLAQTFCIDFLATEENFQRLFEADTRPSAMITIFEAADDPDTKAFNEAGVNADPMPNIPEMGYVWDAWVNATLLTFTGEMDAAAALQQAVDQIRQQIEAE